MKIISHRREPDNKVRPVLVRILVPATAFLLMLLVNSSPVQSGEQKLKRDLIDRQMFSDMFYGADDYFGENTDLSYADGAKPTVIQPKVVVVATTPTASSGGGGGGNSAPPPPPPVVIAPVQTGGGGL
jgi:hypothetical protein